MSAEPPKVFTALGGFFMKRDQRERPVFVWILISIIIITLLLGSYESYTQKYVPDYSILSLLHNYGYLKEYPVIYEPSKGIWHPMGWIGSGMMIIMMLYSLRKRISVFSSLGLLRRWLTVHMFLGIMGPIFVTFHTTFKFSGIIATSYWSMIATMIFGILGRYIYVQIPRSIAGAEFKVQDIERIIQTIDSRLGEYSGSVNITGLSKILDSVYKPTNDIGLIKALFYMFKTDIAISFKIYQVNKILKKEYSLPWNVRRKIDFLLKKKGALIRRKNLLNTSHRLLHYWHIVHIPLAIVMFLIMILHIFVYYLFRPTHA